MKYIRYFIWNDLWDKADKAPRFVNRTILQVLLRGDQYGTACCLSHVPKYARMLAKFDENRRAAGMINPESHVRGRGEGKTPGCDHGLSRRLLAVIPPLM